MYNLFFLVYISNLNEILNCFLFFAISFQFKVFSSFPLCFPHAINSKMCSIFIYAVAAAAILFLLFLFRMKTKSKKNIARI